MKNIFEKKIFKSGLISFILIYFISFIIICRPLPKPIVDIYLEAIDTISNEKSDAESKAKQLKSYYLENSPEYQKGEMYYSEAKSAFDNWITLFQSVLRAECKIEKADPTFESFKESLKEAANKSYRFKKYVEELIPPIVKKPKLLAEPSITVNMALEIFNALWDAILKIWDRFKAEKKEKIEEIVNTLDKLRWKSFGKI